MNWLRFENPWWLVLVPVGLAGLWVISRSRPAPVGCFIRRGLILVLLVVAIAGVEVKLPSPNRCRIYLVDNSGSIFLNQMALLDAIRKDIQGLKPTDRVGLVVFGREASVEVSPIEPARFPPLDVFASRINQEDTDIEKGLSVALSIFPAGFQKEIVLFSDGVETRGNSRRVIPRLLAQGVVVQTMAIGPSEMKDTRIKEFSLPAEVAENESVSARLTLASTFDTPAELYLFEDGQLRREFKGLSLTKDGVTSLSFELPALASGVATYEAQLVVPGLKEICPENNLARGVVVRRGKPAVLYLRTGPERVVETLLKANRDFELSVRQNPEWLNLYDVLVIDDLPRDVLGPWLERIKDFVQQGKGLLVLGGKKSFALGNYQNSPLEELSPVWVSPQDHLALVIVLDGSGSMAEPVTAERNKFTIAREALREAVKLLEAGDKLEVIAFSEQHRVIYPMSELARVAELDDRLAPVQPHGGTALLSPLRQALNDLVQTEAARKHIILISDGDSTTGETPEEARTLGEKLKNSGITISTIATGIKVGEIFLKNLSAGETNGRFYPVSDFLKLRECLADDLAYYKELYLERPDLKVEIKATDEILKEISELPALSGYNRTALKERSKLLAGFEDNAPLVASWLYGLGRVITFTSSLDGRWCGDWLGWEKLAQFWTQIIRWLTPARDFRRDFILETRIEGNRLIVSGEFRNRQLARPAGRVMLELTNANGQTIKIDFELVRPNKYEVVLPELSGGIYYLTAYQVDAEKRGGIDLLARTAAVIPYSREWQDFQPNLPLLDALATMTGGKLIKDLNQINTARQAKERSWQDKNWLLILISLGLLVIDLWLDSPRTYWREK